MASQVPHTLIQKKKGGGTDGHEPTAVRTIIGKTAIESTKILLRSSQEGYPAVAVARSALIYVCYAKVLERALSLVSA